MTKGRRTGDVASVLLPLLLLAGLGAVHDPPPVGFDIADNPLKPWTNYNPNTQTGTCYWPSCNTYDWWHSTGTGGQSCDPSQFYNNDVDGDGAPALHATQNPNNPDDSCIVLEDWDGDGTCDHRVYDMDRQQTDTPYEPVLFTHTYVSNGIWMRGPVANVCTGWSP